MEKIGLISYHYYQNYGTCLQAYALQQYLNHLGIENEYIDFGQCEYPGAINQPSLSDKIKKYLRNIKYAPYHIKDRSNLNAFEKFKALHLNISRRFSLDELRDIENRYSKFIVGSDQTWSPTAIGTDYYKYMLLSFLSPSAKKYSYASSMGNVENLSKVATLLYKNLSSFRNISVRERSSQVFLQNLLQREISFVVDPTLLIGPEIWTTLTNSVMPLIDGDYVFCYLLGGREDILKIALNIAKKNNAKLIVITYRDKFKHYSDLYLEAIGPFEFVNLIRNAKVIVTDSFHGTVFSVNFSKNFFSFYKYLGGRTVADNNRIFSFLQDLKLENQLYDDSLVFENVDYSETYKILNDKKEKSKIFLNSILFD